MFVRHVELRVFAEGRVGNGVSGDIAIDDIQMLDGTCPGGVSQPNFLKVKYRC